MAENTPIITTETIDSILRPPRVAVFYDSTDKKWGLNLPHLIEVFCTIWGGENFIIVPTDGEEISSTFQKILKTYNPDFIATYQLTGADLQETNPSAFNKIVQSHIDAFKRDNPAYNGNEIEKDIKKQLLDNPYYRSFKLGDKITKFVKTELSVFHFQEHIREIVFEYSVNTPHHLMSIASVLTNANEKPKRIHYLSFKGYDKQIKLIGFASLGKEKLLKVHLISKVKELEKEYNNAKKYAPASYRKLFGKLDYLRLVSQDFVEHNFGKEKMDIVAKAFWQKRIDIDDISLFNQIKKSLDPKAKVVETPFDFYSYLPFPVSSLGLSYHLRTSDRTKEFEQCPVVVMGNSLEDYCLYYSLSRLRYKVYWLPYSTLTKDAKAQSIGYSYHLLSHLRGELDELKNRKIFWLSNSIKEARRKKIPNLLEKTEKVKSSSGEKIDTLFEFQEDYRKLVPYTVRMYEKGNANNSFVYQFSDDKGMSPINTPMPKCFEANDPLKHSWISELQVRKHQYPSASFLSEIIFEDAGFSYGSTVSTRVSEGIHYQSPNFGGLIQSNDIVSDTIFRPRVNFIQPKTIFDGLFNKAECSIAYSDKGIYFSQVMAKFGGFDSLVSYIKNPDYFSIFEKFTSSMKNDIDDDSLFMRDGQLNDKRKYLNFEKIKIILKDDDKTNEFIEKMLEIGILKRGFALKCHNCKNSAWYSLDEVGQNFICKRCENINLITKQSFIGKDKFELEIHYKLDEIFYQFWLNNGYITALTLNKLKDKSESFLFIPETEIKPTNSDKAIEVDIFAIVDGGVYLGEAKKDNTLSPKLVARLVSFKKSIPIKGLVFASWEDRWSNDFKTKISSASKETEIIKYSKSDLL